MSATEPQAIPEQRPRRPNAYRKIRVPHETYPFRNEFMACNEFWLSTMFVVDPKLTAEPSQADGVVYAELHRLLYIHRGVLALAGDGLGPNAILLTRPMFEGLAIANWAHQHAVETETQAPLHMRFIAQQIHEANSGNLLINASKPERGPQPSGAPDPPLSDDEMRTAKKLFGNHGHRNFTGENMHTLGDALSDTIAFGGAERLQGFMRSELRYINQMMHSSWFAYRNLATAMVQQEGEFWAGPYLVQQALRVALDCLISIMFLNVEHFELGNDAAYALGRNAGTAIAMFESEEPVKVARHSTERKPKRRRKRKKNR